MENNYNQQSAQQNYQQPYYYPSPPRRKRNIWPWIAGGAAVLIIVLAIFALPHPEDDTAYLPTGENVVVLHVEGTISADTDDTSSYNQQYLLDTIDRLIEDDYNLGLLLYVDSPGGEVTAGDELANKLIQYKQTTGRPLYVYGQSTVASGAYWISCAADKIILNKYCITGSIGVTYGTMLDFSGLLEKYGVKAVHIDSGANKSMGDVLTGLTDQQKAILQSMIDEYYQYFVEVVAEGRSMTEEQVRVLADGRIYSATQAVDNGLADQVGYFDEALTEFMTVCKVTEDQVYEYSYIPTENFWDSFNMSSEQRVIDTLLDQTAQVSGFLTYYDGGMF